MKKALLAQIVGFLMVFALSGCSSFSRDKQIDVVESGLACKWERTTGSHIKRKVCRTAEQTAKEAKQTREQLRKKQSGVRSG